MSRLLPMLGGDAGGVSNQPGVGPSIFSTLFGGGSANQPMQGGTVSPATLTPEPIGQAAGPAQGNPTSSIFEMLYGSPEYKQAMLSNGLMNLGAGILKASGPTTIPTSTMSAFGQGLQGAQQGIESTRDRFAKDMMLGAQFDSNRQNMAIQKQWMDYMQGLAGGPRPPGTAVPTAGGGGSVGGGPAPDSYYGGLSMDESSNNPQARHPLGGAGQYGFMPQTWDGARAAIPGLPAHPTQATPEQQLAAAQWVTQQNGAVMQRALGRAPTGGELRLAHFFGGAGASRLLGLDPNMTFDQVPDGVLGMPTRTVIEANPQLRGVTIGSLIQNYRRRYDQFNPLGGPAPTQTAAAPDITRAGSAMPQAGQVYLAPDGRWRVRGG